MGLGPRAGPIVIACKHGHERSQMAAAELRERGSTAVLAGGFSLDGEGLPVVDRADLAAVPATSEPLGHAAAAEDRPRRLSVAGPPLPRSAGEFLFVDPPQVPAVARETGAIPFDIEGVELSHEGERCSFDTMLRLFGLESEKSLARLALIVRGADTARPDLAPEAAGLARGVARLVRLRPTMTTRCCKRLRGLRCLVRVAALRRRRTPQLAREGRLT